MHPKQPYTETPYAAVEAKAVVGPRFNTEHQTVDDAEVIAKPHGTEAQNASESENERPWYNEDGMVKRIVAVAVVLVLGYFCYLGYNRYKTNRNIATGEIVSDDISQPSSAPEGDSTAKPARPIQTVPASPLMAPPRTDTIAPNPTNGQAFTGAGKFQVYRQGNITWRVNTESGESCILFATQEEWRKPIVYSHGCNAS
jgi:hypothetical protein